MPVKTKQLFLISLLLICSISVFGNNDNLEERNLIGWYTTSIAVRFSEKWSSQIEYNFRRNNFIVNWQQSLFRIYGAFHVHPKIALRIGYAWIETFPYSTTPLNIYGKQFTEHRAFQSVFITDKISIIDFSHRLMLEQRFVGKYLSNTSQSEEAWPLQHRARYMLRVQIPFSKTPKDKNLFYVALYDEIMIGFGRNVGNNIFDQNRVGVLLGYQVNPKIKIEAGYLNQTLMHPRKINSRNLIQINNGIILNTVFNFNIQKKKGL